MSEIERPEVSQVHNEGKRFEGLKMKMLSVTAIIIALFTTRAFASQVVVENFKYSDARNGLDVTAGRAGKYTFEARNAAGYVHIDWGDGQAIDKGEENGGDEKGHSYLAIHNYRQDGWYTVTLTFTDANGKSITRKRRVRIHRSTGYNG